MAAHLVNCHPCETGVPAVKVPAAVYPHDTNSPPTPITFPIAITPYPRACNPEPDPSDNHADIPPEYKSMEVDGPPNASATPLPKSSCAKMSNNCSELTSLWDKGDATLFSPMARGEPGETSPVTATPNYRSGWHWPQRNRHPAPAQGLLIVAATANRLARYGVLDFGDVDNDVLQSTLGEDAVEVQ